MLYNIYAIYNYACSSIILSVKFTVSCPWPEVWSQGDATECLEAAIRLFAIVCGGSGGGLSPEERTGDANFLIQPVDCAPNLPRNNGCHCQ